MYNRQYWKDHVTQYENRYREQTNPDGTISHIPIEGEILQEGTPQNATNFNNLETGVFAGNELGAELMRIMLEELRAKKFIISPTKPTGNWKLWLQDLGEVPDYPHNDPSPTFLLLETAPLNAPGSFAVMDDTGNGETITNMTNDPRNTSDNDIIIEHQ